MSEQPVFEVIVVANGREYPIALETYGLNSSMSEDQVLQNLRGFLNEVSSEDVPFVVKSVQVTNEQGETIGTKKFVFPSAPAGFNK